ncbi:MAG: biotin--[acetyl-CoA-carboxylase] ligase, partial [Bacteroidia bacterium]
VREVIEDITGLDVKIKWPNDILVNNKKIAGILIENSIRGNTILYSIAGIGINVNQEVFSDFPLQATSLKNEMKKNFSISEVLNKLCLSFNKWYAELDKENFKLMRNSYLKTIYQIGKSTKYKSKNEIFKGTIRGVNSDGKLQIENENGELLNFSFKEVTYLFDELPLINP